MYESVTYRRRFGELPENPSFDTLCSFVPASVIAHLADQKHREQVFNNGPPQIQQWHTCVLFADISGYTRLTECIDSKGPKGSEVLANYLRAFFVKLLSIITSQGG
eukprot:160985_1